MPQCAGEGKGPVGSVWLRLSPTLTTARRAGQGGSGQALPPRAPPSRGRSRDCKPKVDDYPVTAKRRNELLFGFGQPFT